MGFGIRDPVKTYTYGIFCISTYRTPLNSRSNVRGNLLDPSSTAEEKEQKNEEEEMEAKQLFPHKEEERMAKRRTQNERRAAFAHYEARCIQLFAPAAAGDRHQHCRTERERQACVAAIGIDSSACLNAVLARLYYDLRESRLFTDIVRQEVFSHRNHRFNMEVDLPPHPPRIGTRIRGRSWSAKIDDISL
jgi:hypothetical protein